MRKNVRIIGAVSAHSGAARGPVSAIRRRVWGGCGAGRERGGGEGAQARAGLTARNTATLEGETAVEAGIPADTITPITNY